ncbi:putative DNA binding 3-demethylubiquinone-9 3-methyltransferase protein [Enhygromyxa salina]|uniref:Putative DNA binding 3-demethylubiquinone-9 3-methyltransferase protein n=1 Tax=Enhygromyxa salina TaxID=215803 RepID=A0A0C2CZP6_9BACT|nr:VOC family protein [Enhygromyxa salina]KIG15090.1 putative DNA binding 3-demethylubiquinone-9 3-methyltransferase protein [Enhygromyxa salina]
MSVQSTTHLNFRGDARDALTFYQSVFGGELTLVTYADAHAAREPSEANQVMWGQVAAENGFSVMAYDVPSSLPFSQGENAFFVSVRGDSEAEIQAYWNKLSEGASVIQAIGPSGWAKIYGMLKDRFGVVWVLDVLAPYDAS